MNEEHFRKLERMYKQAPINQFYKPQLHITEGEAEFVIAVREDLFHAAGAVHGSVYCKAVDDSMFFAVNSIVEEVFVLTVNITTNLMRPISSGEIKAKGKVVFSSKNLFMAEAVLFDADGKTIGTGSGTFVRGRTPLTPEIGYK
jgi:uncharacterized protein (TIGR00369 family)